MTQALISVDYLRDILSYDPANGLFFWRGSGRRAGWLEQTGYRRIWIAAESKKYFEHRLAWFYHHGVRPIREIDHINGNTIDNRIANLREATSQENSANCAVRKNNILGIKGICIARGKYRARIRGTHIGYFETLEEAERAFSEASDRFYGEFSLDRSRRSGNARDRTVCPAIARTRSAKLPEVRSA